MSFKVNSVSKFVKVSPTKAIAFARLAKGKRALDVVDEYSFVPNKAAKAISKTVKSAVANAYHNFNLKKEDLTVSVITIDKGPVRRKLNQRARGSRDILKVKTSHIKVVLESPVDEKKVLQEKSARDEELKTRMQKELEEAKKQEEAQEKQAEKKEISKKASSKSTEKLVKDVNKDTEKTEESEEKKSEIPHKSETPITKNQAKSSEMWGLKSFKDKFFRRKSG